jgi:NAD-dependent SIR2 family protein deacetylase
MRDVIAAAARAIASAEGLLISAGAGMGVDSGLPDFRGGEGFWRAYPPLAALGLSFEQIATPRWFARDPALAWGFYGHRLNLYRDTPPHAGFARLIEWIRGKPAGGFVVTSNVDGHFQRAGFPPTQVFECHGSIHHLQCISDCQERLWPVPAAQRIPVDPATCRATGDLPRCPDCGAVARPNILMFADGGWRPDRSDAQQARFTAWLDSHAPARLTLIEIGAGKAVATLRRLSEKLQSDGAILIRINPRDPEGPPGTLSLPLGALAAIEALAHHLDTRHPSSSEPH